MIKRIFDKWRGAAAGPAPVDSAAGHVVYEPSRPLSPSRVLRNLDKLLQDHAVTALPPVLDVSTPLWHGWAETGEVPIPVDPITSADGAVCVSYRKVRNDIVVEVAAVEGAYVESRGLFSTEIYAERRLLLVLGDRAVNQGLSNIALEIMTDGLGVAVVRLPDHESVRAALTQYTLMEWDPDGGGDHGTD